MSFAAAPKAGDQKQRILELGSDEQWTDFHEKINDLLILEKKARQDNDSNETAKLCKEIIQAAFDKKEWSKLREWLLMLVRRRGQTKQAIIDMTQLALQSFLPSADLSREEKFNLLSALRDATDGKMFVEREYATTTRQLVEMYEADGKIDEAVKIIQEIQIETYGSLENKEKVDFILYQMKLVLLRNDYVRCHILSKKISSKAISEEGLEASKVLYYKFMVRYYIHEKQMLEACKCYQTIFNTLNKAKDQTAEMRMKLDPTGEETKQAFQNFVLYLLIAPYDNEKVDLLNITESENARELEQEDLIAKFVRKLLTYELMPLKEEEIAQQMNVFEPFQPGTTNHKRHLSELVKQLIQHNVRVIEKYYSRIRLPKLAQLVGVSQQRAEAEICDMVVSKRISAKINRLEGIVVFNHKKQYTNDRLSSWNSDVMQILNKVEHTCHLINREQVIHQ